MSKQNNEIHKYMKYLGKKINESCTKLFPMG